ncbi:Multicopper oxidase, type [Salix suchowensis]|nr:Multicopper oxidase, type [Salix suchowensis]
MPSIAPCSCIYGILVLFLVTGSFAGDPYVFFDWTVSYLIASPLGIKQQVIGINGQFPGPTLNVTTNWNVVVNVKNDLDEPLLITWNGVQHRKNSWQDGVLGTNCPIPAGWNWTYQFQVKDQIGSFFYFPSLNFQRSAGGYGGIIINNRDIIPLPFAVPDADVVLFISDWYTKSHKKLRKDVEDGKDLGVPDGILINGFGPYRYDEALVQGGISYQIINIEPGNTYRFRVHNVGISTSLNFRIQNHNLLLVETEGSYTVQQNYTNMDIHVGQSYSFLVTMDQTASSDYYIVASPRYVNSSKASGVAILHYANSQGPASGPLPDPPNEYDMYFSMSQARSIRWNISAGAARPNPQGSFKYGQITVTDVYVIVNRPAELIDGKWCTTLNGISYLTPSTPLKLAQQYNIPGVYKLDFPNTQMNRHPKVDTSLINGTFKGFMEIIFQNNDTTVQSYHLDGYAFFVVGMDFGVWTENSRGTYNKWDGVARSTTQVFPGAWTAILVSLDNAGIWNLRAENLDSWYLGQEVYLSIMNPEIDKSEVPLPDNTIYCGALSSLQKDQARRYSFSCAPSPAGLSRTFLVVLIITLYVTIDETQGKRLFYYFVESERNPSKDPVVLWLNGGPGCSSFDGFVYEHGPFNFEAAKTNGDLPKLHLNPYSWSKLLYLDSPAGVGLSYSKNETDYITGDIKTATDSHAFLLKWFELYPEFLSNPFFISGESYAGIYVPTLAYEVVKGLDAGVKPGYLVGNGVTDDEFDGNALEVTKECTGNFYNPLGETCESKLEKVYQDVEGLNIYDILEPCYYGSNIKEVTDAKIRLPSSFRQLGETERPLPVRKRMFGRAWPFRAPVRPGIVPTWPQLLNGESVPCTDDEVATSWLNNEAVRKAIHAEPESVSGTWELCTDRITFHHDAGSMIKYHRNLTLRGIRALIFSGDHDMCVPYTGSEAWTRSMGYDIVDEWRPWTSNGQVAGYTQGYANNLTFLTMKGAGHTVPEYKPREALDFYSRFLAGKPI